MSFLLPKEIFDQHMIALGKTGAGKSSALRVLVEHLLERNQRVIMVTAKADWWGLKLAADGKHAGYPVPIFGGEHADMPLHHLSGKTIAELLGTGDRSAVLQMRDFMPGERTTFWIDFASTLFRVLRGKLFLVIDEVHNFAPKGGAKQDPKAAMMLHWSNKLASEARGLGITLIGASQRPAKVHNDFLTSCETLIAMRVTTKWDREAIEDWIVGCGDPEIGKAVLNSLAQMKRGDAWVWSPEAEFGPKQIHFPMFKTYDSFRPQTPQDVKGLKGWADVDLEEVKKKLEFVVKEAEANDPAKLKARIAELQRALAAKVVSPAVSQKSDIRRVEERAIAAAVKAQREADEKQFAGVLQNRDVTIRELQKELDAIGRHAQLASKMKPAYAGVLKLPAIKIPGGEIQRKDSPHKSASASQGSTRHPTLTHPRPDVSHGEMNGNGDLTPYQRDILRGLAELEAIGRVGVPTALAAAAAGKSHKSSTWDRYMAKLNGIGFTVSRTGRISLTEEGRAHAPASEQVLTSEDLQAKVRHLLTPYQRDVFNALVAAGGEAMSVDELAEKSGKSRQSSTWDRYLASLGGFEVMERPGPGQVKAADWLFLE